uniref:Osmotin-like protein n=1 Tax=Aegilops tauschii subsp. strangulata TaxID=200361 RepID=A0A453DUZ2_AEGTS
NSVYFDRYVDCYYKWGPPVSINLLVPPPPPLSPTAPSRRPPTPGPAAFGCAPAERPPPGPGSSAAPPQVSLHHGGDEQSSYGVSVVDGFNVGLSVTPHEGRGNCPVLACRKDLTQTCPGELQVRA